MLATMHHTTDLKEYLPYACNSIIFVQMTFLTVWDTTTDAYRYTVTEVTHQGPFGETFKTKHV